MTDERFRRDAGQRMLGGVCAGLGRHCDLDPVIFRIVLAVLSATGGLGLVFYGFVWLLVPLDGEEENEARRLLSGRVDGAALTAVLCALVGCGLFLSMLNNGDVLSFGGTVAVLLAGAGYWSRQRGAEHEDPLAAQAAADAPPEAKAPPRPDRVGSWWRDPAGRDAGAGLRSGTGYLWGPADAGVESEVRRPGAGRPGGGPGAASCTGGWPWTQEPRPPRPRALGGWTFLLALLAGGLGAGLTWREWPMATSLQLGLACALGVFGLGIAVSSLLGRTGAGSMMLAVFTAVLLTGASLLPENITADWMRADWSPAAASQVRERYELGSGVGTLDLHGLKLAEDGTVTTHVRVGAGRLVVIVPHDALVRVRAQVGLGDVRLPRDDPHDVDVAPGRDRGTTLPAPAGTHGGTVDLTLEVGLGQAEVKRAAA
ncbi:PspC domain-containing protein [Streptomyces sp. NPDC058045]|uniref:PspC domain-containing protein n=1 Tax=Streptomyces sp. NPDC058045 TaxID=3346311 RepID=UPI0036E29FE2